jgi:hypothetical protein
MPITPNDYTQPPLQIRRGHISSVTDYQAAAGELVYSTNTNQLFIGDGTTVGGILIAELNQPLYTTSSVTFANITATNLTAGSSTYIVYYNTASGQLSYDVDYGGGGGGGGSSFDLSTVTNQALFTTSSVTFNNITATNTVTTNNIQSADSIITLKQLTGVVIEGSTDGLLYSKANNNLSLSADYPNSVGGRIALQYGENSGIFLGNHNQTQAVTINTATGLTIHPTLRLDAANATITTATVTYVKSDNYLGSSNNNNLFFGNGSAQAILYANGAQNLQLSANASTGLGAKIFIESGETGAVKLGHFNNNAVLTVSTTTVNIGAPTTFTSNIRATGLTNSTASFVLYYNNSNNEITYGAAATTSGSSFDLSTVTNQALFTTSTVTFNALTVSTTATISANGKIITTATGAATTLELWNESSTIAHYNALKFFRKRGTNAVNSNQVLAAIQVDSFQTTNGYASNYSLVDTFPGLRWQAAANASANSNPTRIEILNRPTYSASLPYPYNLTNQNTTASSVIATLRHNDVSTELLSRLFQLRDTYQGFNNTRGAGFTATSGVVGQFGVNLNGSTDAGNQFIVNNTQAWTNNNGNTNSQNYILFKGRTNNVNYSSLDTSGSGQINWFNSSNLLVPPGDNSVVKGPNLQLNAVRHSLLDKTVNAWFDGPYPWGGGTARLWNTSTQAGDVLGTISFQGGLTGSADSNVVEGAVDGVLLRAYAKNNWSGDQTSTNTNVTYTDNQSALRIEITTSTTIGALETGGLRQQYKTVFEIDGTTATFNTIVDNKNNVIIKDTLYTANKVTNIASTASQVVGSFDSTAYNAAKFIVKVVEGTTLHFVEISLITDGTDIWKVEYGTNTSDGSLGTFSTNLNGTVVELLFAATAVPTNMWRVKLKWQILKIILKLKTD